jgi:hypothetical protein
LAPTCSKYSFSGQTASFSNSSVLLFASNSHCESDLKQPAISMPLPECCAPLYFPPPKLTSQSPLNSASHKESGHGQM